MAASFPVGLFVIGYNAPKAVFAEGIVLVFACGASMGGSIHAIALRRRVAGILSLAVALADSLMLLK